MRETFRCPVEGCDWWAALSGYTERAIRAVKTHVQKDHADLGGMETRRDGGIVDRAVADALTARSAFPEPERG